MKYLAYHAHSTALQPLRRLASAALPTLKPSHALWPRHPLTSHWAATLDTWQLSEVTHQRPDWGITDVNGLAVVEQTPDQTPFATLRHFAKPEGPAGQSKVLLVAPMSGHFATLLRDTVRTMLVDHDVYITDWHSARDVSLHAGRFGMDEYTEHLMRFLRHIGPGTHMVAICQPCVAALSATALMSEDKDEATPASLSLMAGPIDCRISPTKVNKLATTKPMKWFEEQLISTVPRPLPGAGRRVYPGFMQLSAFISMNPQRHMDAFKNYYANHLKADWTEMEKTRAFYAEYMAVADLPAEFYLETVDQVFQRHVLPKGELMYRGRPVDPGAIRRTALITVEGARDDICAPGQTLAAQDLCTTLRPHLRSHYVQAGVGHYGVFSGRRWQQQIYPLLRQTIQLSRLH